MGVEEKLHNNECFQLDSTSSSSCSVLLILRNWRKMMIREKSHFYTKPMRGNLSENSTEKGYR
jgi:hypothetical protein